MDQASYNERIKNGRLLAWIESLGDTEKKRSKALAERFEQWLAPEGVSCSPQVLETLARKLIFDATPPPPAYDPSHKAYAKQANSLTKPLKSQRDKAQFFLVLNRAIPIAIPGDAF